MKNSFYVNDGYFQKILLKYFDNIGWKEENNHSNPYIHHANFSSCNTCKITNNFISTSTLGNKRILSDNLSNSNLDNSYLLPYYTFDRSDFEKLRKYFNNKDYWIIKPEDAMRQEGIIIINNYYALNNYINDSKISGKYNKWIMQKYIINPLLINNKKCHLRVYGLICKNKERFWAYIYKKGYIYVADKNYSNDRFFDPEIHITTSCNNLEFPREFNKRFGMNKFQTIIYPQLAKIMKDSISVSYHDLFCPNSNISNYMCYKMVAYDIIIDNNFQAYLMEANTKVIGMASSDPPGNCKSKTPSLQTPEFKKELMTEIMNIVLSKGQYKNFELIFDTSSSANKIIEDFSNYDNNNNNIKQIMVLIGILLLMLVFIKK